jgi:chromosome segregation ATPase
LSDPFVARRWPTQKLFTHFFFEATFIQSTKFQIRQIMLDFLSELHFQLNSLKAQLQKAIRGFQTNFDSSGLAIFGNEQNLVHKELRDLREKLRDYYSMKAEFDDLQQEIDAKTRKCLQLSDSYQEIATENTKLKARISLLEKQKDAPEVQLSQAEERLRQAQIDIQKLRATNDLQEIEIQKLHNVRKSQQTQIEWQMKAMDENQQLRARIVSFESEINALRERNATATTRIVELEQSQSDLNNANAELQRALSAMAQPHGDCPKRSKVETQPSLSPSPSPLTQTPEIQSVAESVPPPTLMTTENSREKSEIACLLSQITQLEHKLSEQHGKLKNVSSAFALAKRDLATREKEITTLRHLNANLKLKLQETLDEADGISESLSRFVKKREKSDSTRNFHIIVEERDQLQAKLSAAQADLETADEQLSLLNRRLSRKDRKCERLNDRMQAVQRQVIALQTLRQEVIVKCDQKSDDIILQNRSLTRRIDELQTEISFLQQAKARVDTLLGESTNEYEKEIRTLSLELAAIRSSSEKAFQKFRTTIANLDQKNKQADDECKQSQMKLNEVQQQLEREQLTKQTSEEAVRRLKELIAELKDENEELTFLRKRATEILFGRSAKDSRVSSLLSEIRRLKDARSVSPI